MHGALASKWRRRELSWPGRERPWWFYTNLTCQCRWVVRKVAADACLVGGHGGSARKNPSFSSPRGTACENGAVEIRRGCRNLGSPDIHPSICDAATVHGCILSFIHLWPLLIDGLPRRKWCLLFRCSLAIRSPFACLSWRLVTYVADNFMKRSLTPFRLSSSKEGALKLSTKYEWDLTIPKKVYSNFLHHRS